MGKEIEGWDWGNVGTRAISEGVTLGKLACRNCGTVTSGAVTPECDFCGTPYWEAARRPPSEQGQGGGTLTPRKALRFVKDWLWDCRPFGQSRSTSGLPWGQKYIEDAAKMVCAAAHLRPSTDTGRDAVGELRKHVKALGDKMHELRPNGKAATGYCFAIKDVLAKLDALSPPEQGPPTTQQGGET